MTLDRALLGHALETLPAGAYTCDPAGLITYYNRQAVRLWGREPALNDPVDRYCGSFRIFAPDGSPIPHDRCWMARALHDRQDYHGEEIVIERPDGTRVAALAHASPIRDAEGRLVGSVNVLVDITERRKAEIALRESEGRFANFMQHLPGLAWIKDVAGRYVFVNDSAERAFRHPRAELLGRTDDEIFPVETARQFRENDLKAVEGGAGVEVVETLEHEDGVHYSLVSKFPIPGSEGTPTLIGGMAIDITDRKLAEAALQRSERALKDADRRKDEFLATLAHELRNPLAPIRSGLQLLRQGPQDAASARVHEMMDRQIGHLVRLVDDLLEVSRISRGKIELRKERVELAAVVSAALETSRPLIEACRHHLVVSLPAEPLALDADLLRLAQVLANLLQNAAKYTDDGGTIRLSARRAGSEAVVSVRDTGVGLPAEALARVFEPFAQSEHTRGRAKGGLGIGLSLVWRLVELHGGRVEARSEGPGRGSEFVVSLPLSPSDASERTLRSDEAAGAEPAAADRLDGRRILVVDDNRDAAESLCLLLRRRGAEVEVAYDGGAALERLADLRPTHVLLDLGLPGIDGCEVARRIRERGALPGVVLIALTGWGQAEARESSREAGFDHHLVKPVEIDALASLLLRSGRRADAAS